MKIFKRLLVVVVGAMLVAVIGILSQVQADLPLEQLKLTYANGNSRFMALDGYAVHYRDEGSGQPLVLVHGMFSSLHTWDGWVRELSDQFRLIRVDLPGFGLTGPSSMSTDYSIQAMVSFLERFSTALKLDSFSLAGNSLGGWISWEYTLAHPTRVDRLILIDAAGWPMAKLPHLIGLARVLPLRRLFLHITPRFVVAMNLNEVYGDRSKVTDSLIDRYHDLMLRPGNRKAFLERVAVNNPDHTSRLNTITSRTLIMWGRDDRWIPLENGDRFQKAIPTSSLIVYGGIGHVPMEESPQRTALDARRFLAADGKAVQ